MTLILGRGIVLGMEKRFIADRDAIAQALLRSCDFMELGFSARRPLGSSSLISRDVLAVLGIEYEQSSEEEKAYAERIWEDMRTWLPKYIEKVLKIYAMSDAANCVSVRDMLDQAWQEALDEGNKK